MFQLPGWVFQFLHPFEGDRPWIGKFCIWGCDWVLLQSWPQTEMTLSKSPKQVYNFQKMMVVMLLAVMFFFVRHRITPLLRPLSTTTKRASKPLDRCSPVIRSWDICLNGSVCSEGIGLRGGMVGCVFVLFCWWTEQPSTYFLMYLAIPGHQQPAETSWWVFK